MPTNPTTPNTNASVDRLALGVDSPRGVEPSFPIVLCACNCFEAEPLGAALGPGNGICFEAEPLGAALGPGNGICFGAEASAQTPNGDGCYCAEEA